MATDWTKPTDARTDASNGLAIIDGLMEYASDKRGRRSRKEVSLYMASVTFAYAVWENFVEEIAIELAGKMADANDGLRPDQLDRPAVRELIEQGATPWELSVHPGWRDLWVDRVKRVAVGDDGGGFGINTANSKNTKSLFKRIGISPFPDKRAADLDALVELRGEIVHTAKMTQPIYKAEVAEWQGLVRSLCDEVDAEARKQCQNWLAE